MRAVAILSTVGLVCLGVANWAAADDGRGVWYVLPSYHQAGVEKANMKYRQGANQIKFNTTFGDDTGLGFAIGYGFDAVYRVEIEYQGQTNDLKVPGTNPFNGSSLKSTTAAVDVWRDFAPWHQLRAYVGVGVGGGKLELDNLDTNFYIGRLGGGVAWYFRRDMAVDIGYRYQFATSNPELSGNSEKVTTDYSGQSVQIGLRYEF